MRQLDKHFNIDWYLMLLLEIVYLVLAFSQFGGKDGTLTEKRVTINNSLIEVHFFLLSKYVSCFKGSL